MKAEAPHVGYLLSRAGGLILCSFNDGGSMDPKNPPAPKPADQKDGEKQNAPAAAGSPEMIALLKDLIAGQAAMQKILAQIAAGAAGSPEPAAKDKPGTEPGTQASTMSREALTEIAAVKAALAAQGQQLFAIDRERKLTEAVAGAVADLKGWHLSVETLAEMRQLAEKSGENAKEILGVFCANFKRVSPKTPPKDASQVGGSTTMEDPIVAKFAAKGPEVLEKARKAAENFEAARGKLSMTKERFIELAIQ